MSVSDVPPYRWGCHGELSRSSGCVSEGSGAIVAAIHVGFNSIYMLFVTASCFVVAF